MNALTTKEGKQTLRGVRVAIVSARFNDLVVGGLLNGAMQMLAEAGVAESEIIHARVPGAFEVPLAVQKLAESGDVDGVIALAAVIRGDTAHFEYVAGACTDGLLRVMQDFGIPIGFGVLTVDTTEQALARAAQDNSNKGREAAAAVIEMLSLLRDL